MENLDEINENLKQVINNADFLINESNQKLALYDTSYLRQFDMIKYSDLFVLYIKNKYLSIGPSDLVKISTWLNEEWRFLFTGKIILIAYY